MSLIKPGMARLLSRLAIDPSMRQAKLAKSLNVTRSAVNQIWRKLETYHNMEIQGNLDYGAVGLHLIFGWAAAQTNSQNLQGLITWLKNNSFTSFIHESLMTQNMDNRVMFEALVPCGTEIESYTRILDAFRKRPYNLQLHFEIAKRVSNNMNLGLFNNGYWQFDSGFRFEASIDATRKYADILPEVRDVKQSFPKSINLENLVIASALESNYFVTGPEIQTRMLRAGIDPPSERTLRRKIGTMRNSIVQPYLYLENIGLGKRIIFTLEEPQTSDIYKLFMAQSSTFPRTRVLSGQTSMTLIIDIPESTDWLYLSNAISNVIGKETEMCTFIAQQHHERNRLERNISRMIAHKPGRKYLDEDWAK